MKDKLDGKMMMKFAVLGVKTYSFLKDDGDENN